jgi:hypothetical protein
VERQATVLGRTVRLPTTDCPWGAHGLSVGYERTVRKRRPYKQNLQPILGLELTVRESYTDYLPVLRTVRIGASDGQENHQRKVMKKRSLRLSVLGSRTVCEKEKYFPKISREEHGRTGKTKFATDCPWGHHRLSVSLARNSQKHPAKSTLQIHHRISQTTWALETRFGGDVKCH